MKAIKLFAIPMLFIALFTSCSSDDDNPDPVNEEELITDIILKFTNTANAADVVTMTSISPNGQGEGSTAEVVVGNFTSGVTYALELAITNESEDPADDVLNDDIIPEADEHFFTYAVNGLDITMTRDADDIDGPDGTKLGVNTTWVAGAASTGNLRIVLNHEPVGADDSDNFGTVTGGEEDFNITFTDVAIQ